MRSISLVTSLRARHAVSPSLMIDTEEAKEEEADEEKGTEQRGEKQEGKNQGRKRKKGRRNTSSSLLR